MCVHVKGRHTFTKLKWNAIAILATLLLSWLSFTFHYLPWSWLQPMPIFQTMPDLQMWIFSHFCHFCMYDHTTLHLQPNCCAPPRTHQNTLIRLYPVSVSEIIPVPYRLVWGRYLSPVTPSPACERKNSGRSFAQYHLVTLCDCVRHVHVIVAEIGNDWRQVFCPYPYHSFEFI